MTMGPTRTTGATGPTLAQAVDVVRDGLRELRSRRAAAAPGSLAASDLDSRIARLQATEVQLARTAVARRDADAVARFPQGELARLRGVSARERTEAGTIRAADEIARLRRGGR